jgi:hypothetical protein
VRSLIESELASKLDPRLIHELLEAHAEAKRNFYLDHLRPAEVEGGRFCEAAFRILELVTKGSFTPLNKSLTNSEKIISDLASLDSSRFNDSIRLHIPRSLRLVYDVRNKRDAAHLADGIDPNLQDANLVVGVLDWVLAEFIRLYHRVSADQASAIVASIVKRVAPVVQDFEGFLKVLNPGLGASDHSLVVLYQRGDQGATLEELKAWVRPSMRPNLQRTLNILVEKKDYVHFANKRYRITRRGEQYVEVHSLIMPAQLL